MQNSSRPSVDQLKRAIQISEQIQKLEAELASILGSSSKSAAASATKTKAKAGKRKKAQISAEGLANIIAAQKKRWAKVKKQKAKAEA